MITCNCSTPLSQNAVSFSVWPCSRSALDEVRCRPFPFVPHLEQTIDWPSVGTTVLSDIRSNGGLLTSCPQTVQ